MRLKELKEKLQNVTQESRSYYRQYPKLYRDIIIWEDYLECLEKYRRKQYHAPHNYARYDVCNAYLISEKTFYQIHSLLKTLCEDVE